MTHRDRSRARLAEAYRLRFVRRRLSVPPILSSRVGPAAAARPTHWPERRAPSEARACARSEKRSGATDWDSSIPGPGNRGEQDATRQSQRLARVSLQSPELWQRCLPMCVPHTFQSRLPCRLRKRRPVMPQTSHLTRHLFSAVRRCRWQCVAPPSTQAALPIKKGMRGCAC
jgi:hypothetical protein